MLLYYYIAILLYAMLLYGYIGCSLLVAVVEVLFWPSWCPHTSKQTATSTLISLGTFIIATETALEADPNAEQGTIATFYL